MSLLERTAHDVEPYVTFSIAVVLPLAALIGSDFWNRGNTIETRSLAALIAIAITSLPASAGFLYYWFRPRPPLVEPPHWNLRHDSPGTWVLTGIAVAIIMGASIAWPSFVLVGVLAQYVPGPSVDIPATVKSTEKFTWRHARCKVLAEFSVDWGDTIGACVVPSVGPSLIARPLNVGDRVKLKITSNSLGTVLTGVRPDV